MAIVIGGCGARRPTGAVAVDAAPQDTEFPSITPLTAEQERLLDE